MADWMNFRTGERARELLEDFDIIATVQEMALIPKHANSSLKSNVHAAVVASTLGLASVDYARRRYARHEDDDSNDESKLTAYVGAYHAAKTYMSRLVANLCTDGKPDPTVGVFGASLVLERLAPSFFCTHFLYRMGHRYEGHAVARLILEQIAWAYAAHDLDDLSLIEKISTTRCITALKRLTPSAGILYGFLSEKTHIDYSSHMEFLRVENGQNVVLHAQPHFKEYGEVILRLADLFGIIWEISQAGYLETVETIDVHRTPRADRPFLTNINEHMKRIEEA